MNYCKNPVHFIQTEQKSAWNGYAAICEELSEKAKKHLQNHSACVMAVDTYPGVDEQELKAGLESLKPALWICMEDVFCSKEEYQQRIALFMTDDRVFGRMYFGGLEDFWDRKKREAVQKRAEHANGLVVVFGFGAASLMEADLLVYADLARWEIQQRMRQGAGNYHTDNSEEDILRKYKQGYFLEWRMADRHKRKLFEKIDYLLDTNRKRHPVMITGDCFRTGLKELCIKPFRTVPYFDPGVWGGQWMKKVCGLDPKKSNFAWAFDGVPEENSLYFQVEDLLVEVPAMDLVLYRPRELLGPETYARFGAEFPIRFDFLDTMEGQNLSLQVHPSMDYIYQNFGMSYTQDESYYILDAQENACVYLGIRDQTDPEQMIEDLKKAQRAEGTFNAEEYVNKIPARRHDHFLIPAGTVHCSGRGCMVLEISATPYIFTFKLWDWGRLGLDGRPRPIHIDHGKQVIDWSRRTQWVMDNLVNRFSVLQKSQSFT
ncbi:MAG: class I mannose-6-phosphate isomerase, partial [Ileibacterium sp.]|nr:class I mannose-6-phosphate isomerase [Ileibacterium sp.]